MNTKFEHEDIELRNLISFTDRKTEVSQELVCGLKVRMWGLGYRRGAGAVFQTEVMAILESCLLAATREHQVSKVRIF